MQRALVILDGLYTYWEEILEPLNWPSDITKNPILFLLKIFFSKDFNPDIKDILKYLELPPSDILMMISKIITKNPNNTYNTQLINSLDVNYINNLIENQCQLISETLQSFHQILKATSITLWEFNHTKICHSEASQKLRAKLEAEKTTSATVATALAINKAVANIDHGNIRDKTTQSRISNPEKHLMQQTQTNKKILNHLKTQRHHQGSRHHNSNTPPCFSEEDVIDLTDNGSLTPDKFSPPFQKKRKNIQWDSTIQQIQHYNPETTPKQLFAPSIALTDATNENNRFSNQVSIPPQTFSIDQNLRNTHKNQQPFLGQTMTTINYAQNQTPPNPFQRPSINTHQNPRGGKFKGRRRGSS
jgi:hypothetical protein